MPIVSPYGDVFEFLAAFVESMQLDPPWGERRVHNAAAFIAEAYRKLLEGGRVGRTVLLLLYRLGLLKACRSSPHSLDGIHVCPSRSEDGDVSSLVRERVVAWHPTRLLLRYLALQGGYATIDDIARELGCTVKRLTMELYEALLPLVPKRSVLETPPRFTESIRRLCGIGERRGVMKPFNRLRVRNLLAPLLESIGLIEVDGDTLKLTRLGWIEAQRVLAIPQEEIVVTQPLLPQLYAAILAVLYKPSATVYIVTPWVEEDASLLEKLLSLTKGRRTIVIMRDDTKNRKQAPKIHDICRKAGTACQVGLVRNLHAKIYLTSAALVSSANLLATSLGRNYEVGVYYTTATENLQALTEEIASIADYV